MKGMAFDGWLWPKWGLGVPLHRETSTKTSTLTSSVLRVSRSGFYLFISICITVFASDKAIRSNDCLCFHGTDLFSTTINNLSANLQSSMSSKKSVVPRPHFLLKA
jgi:hypothetical protein